jgi:arginine decarboxylase
MEPIRVVWGVGGGPTETAAYDTALAHAGVHNYNLVEVSSVVPEAGVVTVLETAPDLGPAGNRLTVVQGKAVVQHGPAVAGLGWATGPDGHGPGVFYEVSGTHRDTVEESIERGLEAARDLRDWDLSHEDRRVVGGRDEGRYTAAVVLAAYGDSDPIV